MSYVDNHADPNSRIAALATTFAVHAALGLAVITGLKVAGVIEEKDGLDGFFVEVPDNTPAPPPTPEPSAAVDSYILPVAPIPKFDLKTPPVIDVDPIDLTRKPIDLPPIALPSASPAPSPAPSFAAVAPRPIGGSGWISTDDYPGMSVRRNEEGTANYVLQIGANGKVTNCSIIVSTGHQRLDEATCNLLMRRGKFTPATDTGGAKVAGTYSGQVTWRIPD